MKDDLGITITGVQGSYHYSLSKILRNIIKAISLITVLAFLIGALWIYFLQVEVIELQEQRSNIQKDYQNTLTVLEKAKEEQSQLEVTIEQEKKRLQALGEHLERIEDIIGMNPEEEKLVEIEQRLDLAEQTSHERYLFLSNIPSGHPMPQNTKTTSRFGWRTHPVSGAKHKHKGVDIRANIGTEVYATADGVVEYSGEHSSGFGRLIIINHQYSFRTLYAHLDELKVRSKEVVHKGQLIALSGNSGVSTGPHLHYEVMFNRNYLDPAFFLTWSMENYESIFSQIRYIPWESLIGLVKRRHKIEITKASSAMELPHAEN